MNITYEWQFDYLVTLNGTFGDLQDAVAAVAWRRKATCGEHVAILTGRDSFGPPAPENFTPFAAITQAQVAAWLEASLGQQQLAEYDAQLAEMIDQQINPPFIVKGLPWMEVNDAVAQ